MRCRSPDDAVWARRGLVMLSSSRSPNTSPGRLEPSGAKHLPNTAVHTTLPLALPLSCLVFPQPSTTPASGYCLCGAQATYMKGRHYFAHLAELLLCLFIVKYRTSFAFACNFNQASWQHVVHQAAHLSIAVIACRPSSTCSLVYGMFPCLASKSAFVRTPISRSTAFW